MLPGQATLPLLALVLDDDPAMQSLLGRILIEEACGVIPAATLRDARLAASSLRFDLLLIDLRLEDGNGLDFAREHVRRHPAVPFVVISGHWTEELETSAVASGAAAIVKKPVRLGGWLRTLRPLLARRRHELSTALQDAESNVDRWARLLVAAASSPVEPRTTRLLARAAGTSAGAFRHLCHQVHVLPRDARDFVRVLWALDRTGGSVAHVEFVLDVRDRRTTKTLFQRAGLSDAGQRGRWSRHRYLAAQRFIPPGHPAFDALERATAQ
jgi:DNA-binding response OmpR family regulator